MTFWDPHQIFFGNFWSSRFIFLFLRKNNRQPPDTQQNEQLIKGLILFPLFELFRKHQHRLNIQTRMFSMRAFTSCKPKSYNTKTNSQSCDVNKTSHAKIERETHLSLKQIHSQLTNESHTKVSNMHNRKRAMCCNQSLVEMTKPPSSTTSKRREYSTFNPTTKKTTILDLKKKYNSQSPITMVTAYDYTSATNVDNAGIDMILVCSYFNSSYLP